MARVHLHAPEPLPLRLVQGREQLRQSSVTLSTTTENSKWEWPKMRSQVLLVPLEGAS